MAKMVQVTDEARSKIDDLAEILGTKTGYAASVLITAATMDDALKQHHADTIERYKAEFGQERYDTVFGSAAAARDTTGNPADDGAATGSEARASAPPPSAGEPERRPGLHADRILKHAAELLREHSGTKINPILELEDSIYNCWRFQIDVRPDAYEAHLEELDLIDVTVEDVHMSQRLPAQARMSPLAVWHPRSVHRYGPATLVRSRGGLPHRTRYAFEWRPNGDGYSTLVGDLANTVLKWRLNTLGLQYSQRTRTAPDARSEELWHAIERWQQQYEHALPDGIALHPRDAADYMRTLSGFTDALEALIEFDYHTPHAVARADQEPQAPEPPGGTEVEPASTDAMPPIGNENTPPLPQGKTDGGEPADKAAQAAAEPPEAPYVENEPEPDGQPEQATEPKPPAEAPAYDSVRREESDDTPAEPHHANPVLDDGELDLDFAPPSFVPPSEAFARMDPTGKTPENDVAGPAETLGMTIPEPGEPPEVRARSIEELLTEQEREEPPAISPSIHETAGAGTAHETADPAATEHPSEPGESGGEIERQAHLRTPVDLDNLFGTAATQAYGDGEKA